MTNLRKYDVNDSARTRKVLRATPESWTFYVKTNDGKTRIETSGPIDPVSGECLRILQIHIARLTTEELGMLAAFTNRVVTRVKGSR